jgi:hypothetical protein
MRTAQTYLKMLLAVFCMVLFAGQASAATAFLVSCRGESSVTGRFIYVGTYQYSGRYFEQAFTSWCPPSIEVY